MLQKHLKRKEYHTSTEFANDVELIFSNAQQFNDDHTPLWEAAETLKVSIFSVVANCFLLTRILCRAISVSLYQIFRHHILFRNTLLLNLLVVPVRSS